MDSRGNGYAEDDNIVKTVANVRATNFSPPAEEEINLAPLRFHLAFRETSLTIMTQVAEESSLANVCKNMIGTVCLGSTAGIRDIFPQRRALMSF